MQNVLNFGHNDDEEESYPLKIHVVSFIEMKTQVNIVTLLLRREWSSYVDKRVLHSFIPYLYYSYPTHKCFLKHLQQMTFEVIVTKGFF